VVRKNEPGLAVSSASEEVGRPAEHGALSLRLLASLNHEIRTPLSGILGMADLLLETELNDEQREYVLSARDCAESLFMLLNATMELSALEAGAVQADESVFVLSEALAAVFDEARAKARSRGVEIDVAGMDPAQRTVLGDSYRMRQALGALVDHAARYAVSGRLLLRVELWEEAEDRLACRVQIDSPALARAAMEAEAARALIADSSRAGPEARLYAAGLVFLLAERLLGCVGGALRFVHTEIGQARLEAYIPLQPVAVQTGAEMRPQRVGGEARALVVDDNRISRQVIRAMLSKGGWEAECVSGGEEALAKAAVGAYGVVLMDLQMPGLDGYETTRRLRAMTGYGDVPVLALSADVSDEVRVLCREAGVNDFLQKPVHIRQLLAMLNEWAPRA
jgi:CheY-like chemotaxis protein